jgi:hypothetical protein
VHQNGDVVAAPVVARRYTRCRVVRYRRRMAQHHVSGLGRNACLDIRGRRGVVGVAAIGELIGVTLIPWRRSGDEFSRD